MSNHKSPLTIFVGVMCIFGGMEALFAVLPVLYYSCFGIAAVVGGAIIYIGVASFGACILYSSARGDI